MDKDQALEQLFKESTAASSDQTEGEPQATAEGTGDSESEEAAETTTPIVESNTAADDENAEDAAEASEELAEPNSLVFPLSYPVELAHLREQIPFLLDHGLNVEVDLSDTSYNAEVPIRELERLAIELRRNKIKVSAHLPHRDLKLASRDKAIRQHSMDAIQEGLEIGKILGARIAIFHSGFSNHVRPQDTDWWVEECITGLEDLIDRAKEEEVIVALENTWESDEQVIARLFEAIDSPWFRFCCDVGHAACFSGFSPEEWIVQFKDRIANLDFHRTGYDCIACPVRSIWT